MRLTFPSLLLSSALAFSAVAIPNLREDDHGHKPHHSRGGVCTEFRARYEWRALAPSDKADYISAVQCLQRLPPKIKGRPEVNSRYDEFLVTHIDLTPAIHKVAGFLPWHRYYVVLQEKALREECGYRGPIPYWDSSLDADSDRPIHESPIFNANTGFGGDGFGGTYKIPSDLTSVGVIDVPSFSKGCIRDGPFVNYTVSMGPGRLVTKHCLVRNINETYRHYVTSSAVRKLLDQPTYELFRVEMEGYPNTADRRVHDGGHMLVGGDMGNPISSPSDPIFFLHHANLDRLWWIWQQADSTRRLYEIAGRAIATPPYTNVTLETPLVFNTLARGILIKEVMDIHAEPLCYTYP